MSLSGRQNPSNLAERHGSIYTTVLELFKLASSFFSSLFLFITGTHVWHLLKATPATASMFPPSGATRSYRVAEVDLRSGHRDMFLSRLRRWSCGHSAQGSEVSALH